MRAIRCELRFDGAAPDMRAVERMSEQLARRGPDHAGTFADGPLAFGHRRLAIIDLSPSADQPMVGSSLPASLAGRGVDTQPDPVALHHHFTLHTVVPAPRTVLRGVLLELVAARCMSTAHSTGQTQRASDNQ